MDVVDDAFDPPKFLRDDSMCRPYGANIFRYDTHPSRLAR